MKLFGWDISFRRNSQAGREERSQTTLSNPANWLLASLGLGTKAKVSVNDRTALSLSPFWQGIRLIAEGIASLPIGLYTVDENDNHKRVKSHPLDRLISLSPSPLLTSYKFRETMQGIAVLKGNAYALIFKDERTMRPTRLRILRPDMVYSWMDKAGELWYTIWGIPQPVHHLDMIHLRGINLLSVVQNDDMELGLMGENPIYLNRESIAVGIAAQEYEGSLMGNGGAIGGYLTYPHKLTEDQVNEVETRWQKKYGGTTNVGKVPVLGGGLEYKRIALTPQESMLIEARKFSVEEVARIINIPLYKLGHLDRATFNNIEQLSREFYLQTMLPWAENWEAELSMKLLREDEKGKYEFRYDFSNMLRADIKTLGEFIRSAFNAGIISINDGRKMLGMNALDDEWAKKHWVQLNMAEADKRPEPKAKDEPAAPEPAAESKSKLNGYEHHIAN